VEEGGKREEGRAMCWGIDQELKMIQGIVQWERRNSVAIRAVIFSRFLREKRLSAARKGAFRKRQKGVLKFHNGPQVGAS